MLIPFTASYHADSDHEPGPLAEIVPIEELSRARLEATARSLEEEEDDGPWIA